MDSIDTLKMISESSEKYPDRLAIHVGGADYSYEELVSASNAIKRRILGVNASPQRIGLVTADDMLTYASLLAIWSTGAAYVPLNHKNPPERNQNVIDQAEVDLILTSRPDADWHTHLPSSDGPSMVLSTADTMPVPGSLDFPSFDSGRLAYILFTSGSTGIPKGVPISHGNLASFVDTVLNHLDYDFCLEDRFLQMFELTFDLSVMSTFVPWCIGASTHVVAEKGIGYLNVLDTLVQNEVTVALMVPSILAYLRRFFGEIALTNLRINLFCGEALMHDLVCEWHTCVPNARIQNVYGPTEVTIFCTTFDWRPSLSQSEVRNGIVPIGRPMRGVKVEVLSDNGTACESGQNGELCLAGNQVMSGYWNNATKTQEAFVRLGADDLAYKTGDICFWNEGGNLIYCGRKDAQVKIDGHRVELGEVEHYARQFVGTSKAAVVVAVDKTGRNFLELFVGVAGIDLTELRRHLATKLPDYMQPGEITVLDDLPTNLSGKIDRVALASLVKARS